jgi:thiol-disulfide isomerase/thioredoxin
MPMPIETGGTPEKLASSGWLIRLLCLAVLPLMGALGIDQVNAQAGPPMSSKAAELDPFEQRVREYLLKHPEVIMEALQILRERQRAADAETLKRTIAERREEILNDPAAPVGGNPAGDVTLIEFFDYNCPYCRRVAPTVIGLKKADPVFVWSLRSSRSSGPALSSPPERRSHREGRASTSRSTMLSCSRPSRSQKRP